MADIAQLGYRVDSSQLTSATRALDAQTRAAGRTETAIQKMERQYAASIKQAKAFGKVLGTIIVGVTGLVIKNTIDASREQAQLAAVLKSTGGVARQTQQQLNQMADALQQTSTFAAGNVTEMQAVLLTFTKIQGDIFPKAQQAILDMATALGMDLQGAAIQVGKALNDPILGVSALGRAGVQFSETQKDMIEKLVETGKEAEAQTIILKELETQFGGSALAARNTLGGALTVLKNNFNDLLEGDSGGDGVRGTVDAVNELADTLNDPAIKKGMQDIAAGIVTITSALIKGIAQFTGWIAKAKEAFDLDTGRISAADASLQALNDRLGKVNQQRADLAKHDTDILGFIPDPGAEKFKLEELKRLGNEQVELQREITRRINAERFSGVTASVTSTFDPKPAAGAGGKGDGKGGKYAAQKAEEALKRAIESTSESLERQIDLYGQTSEAAQVHYDIEHGALMGIDEQMAKKLIADAQTLDLLDDLAAYEDVWAESARENAEAQRERVRAFEEVNQAIRDEIALLGMSSAQQEIWNNLKWAGVTADSANGQEIIKNTKLLQQMREEMGKQIDLTDSVRDAGRGLFEDIANGVKPINALEDAWERVHQKILSMIAENLMDQLFGKQGDPGGGSAGGWLGGVIGGLFGNGASGASGQSSGTSGGMDWGAIIGSFFGGGRALGGGMRGDRMYQVGERNRPELANIGGRQYLIPGDRGRVDPITSQGNQRPVVNVSQTFYSQGRIDPRTAAQQQQDAATKQRIAASRNG